MARRTRHASARFSPRRVELDQQRVVLLQSRVKVVVCQDEDAVLFLEVELREAE